MEKHKALVWCANCVLSLAVAVPTMALGWGREGHQLVGDIAARYLSAQTANRVSQLLTDDLDANGQPSGRTTLGEVASWPDEIRDTTKGKGTAPWHFDDMPICGTEPKASWCKDGQCASEEIVRLFGVLKNTRASPVERNEAQKWLVHLVGDIHQPLHSADRNHDRGGNAVRVSISGDDGNVSNLHSAWDTALVVRSMRQQNWTAQTLGDAITPQQQAAWAMGTVTDWVAESNAIAKTVAYGNLGSGEVCGTASNQAVVLTAQYADAAASVIAVQLEKAGFRLAGILNAALGTGTEVVVPVLADKALILSRNPNGGPHLPDPQKTPGRATYHTAQKICGMGSTKDERNVPDSEKSRVYAAYGIGKCEGYCSGQQGCEIDHLISLELGGANTEDNLWPQPYDGDWNAHHKDALENKLHHMVCIDKTISLEKAQQEIAADWVSAFQKYVGDRKDFKPVKRCP